MRQVEVRLNNILLENINTSEMVGFEVVGDYFYKGAHIIESVNCTGISHKQSFSQ